MAKKKPKRPSSDRPSFEDALKRLEGIVHLLEGGDIGLNEALAQYEEGVKLLRQSYDLLERAERRIELLSGVDSEGNPATQPLDDPHTPPGGMQSPQTWEGQHAPEDGAPKDVPQRNEPEDTDIDAPSGLF